MAGAGAVDIWAGGAEDCGNRDGAPGAAGYPVGEVFGGKCAVMRAAFAKGNGQDRIAEQPSSGVLRPCSVCSVGVVMRLGRGLAAGYRGCPWFRPGPSPALPWLFPGPSLTGARLSRCARRRTLRTTSPLRTTFPLRATTDSEGGVIAGEEKWRGREAALYG